MGKLRPKLKKKKKGQSRPAFVMSISPPGVLSKAIFPQAPQLEDAV